MQEQCILKSNFLVKVIHKQFKHLFDQPPSTNTYQNDISLSTPIFHHPSESPKSPERSAKISENPEEISHHRVNHPSLCPRVKSSATKKKKREDRKVREEARSAPPSISSPLRAPRRIRQIGRDKFRDFQAMAVFQHQSTPGQASRFLLPFFRCGDEKARARSGAHGKPRSRWLNRFTRPGHDRQRSRVSLLREVWGSRHGQGKYVNLAKFSFTQPRDQLRPYIKSLIEFSTEALARQIRIAVCLFLDPAPTLRSLPRGHAMPAAPVLLYIFISLVYVFGRSIILAAPSIFIPRLRAVDFLLV